MLLQMKCIIKNKNVKYLVKFNQVYHTDINPNYPIRVRYKVATKILYLIKNNTFERIGYLHLSFDWDPCFDRISKIVFFVWISFLELKCLSRWFNITSLNVICENLRIFIQPSLVTACTFFLFLWSCFWQTNFSGTHTCVIIFLSYL